MKKLLLSAAVALMAGGFASAQEEAEVTYLPIDRTADWTISNFDSEEPNEKEDEKQQGYVSYLIDEDYTTFWHTQWNGGKPTCPHFFVVDLGAIAEFDAAHFEGRHCDTSVRTYNGIPRGFQIYTSADDDFSGATKENCSTYGTPALQGTLGIIESEGEDVVFPATQTARYVMVVITSSTGRGAPEADNIFASFAEFDLLAKEAGEEPVEPIVVPEFPKTDMWYQLLNQQNGGIRDNTVLGYYPEVEWTIIPTTGGSEKVTATNPWICGAAPFTDEATAAQKDGQLWRAIANEDGTKYCLVNKAFPNGAISNEILNNEGGQNASRWGYVDDRTADADKVEWFTLADIAAEGSEYAISHLEFVNPVASANIYLAIAAAGQSFQIMRYNVDEASTQWAFIPVEEYVEAPAPKTTYFTFASYNRGGYLTSNGAAQKLSHVDLSTAAVWEAIEVEGEENAYNLKNYADGTFMKVSGATTAAEESVVYILPNGVNELGISLSATSPISSSSCVDANNYNTLCGNWAPSASDWQGTTWVQSVIELEEGETVEAYLQSEAIQALIDALKATANNYCFSVPGFEDEYGETVNMLDEMTPTAIYNEFDGDLDQINAYFEELNSTLDAGATYLLPDVVGEKITIYNARRGETEKYPYLSYVEGTFNTIEEATAESVWEIVEVEDGRYTLHNLQSDTYISPITTWDQTNLAPVATKEEAGTFTMTATNGFVQLLAGIYTEGEVDYPYYYCLNAGNGNLASWVKDHGCDWALQLTDIPTVSISEVATEAAEINNVYDLQGRRVFGTPARGLYIINGRKEIVK